jgi:hypothetical protein
METAINIGSVNHKLSNLVLFHLCSKIIKLNLHRSVSVTEYDKICIFCGTDFPAVCFDRA